MSSQQWLNSYHELKKLDKKNILFVLQQEEINLRPNRNFTTALRPSVPTMLPKSAQAAPSTGPPMMSGSQFMSEQRANNLNPLLAKQVSILFVSAFLYH